MKQTLLERFMDYLRATGFSADRKPQPEMPAVTISREKGAGCSLVTELAASYLREHFGPRQPWAIVDRDFLDCVIREQNLPKEMREFMSEDSPPFYKDAIETVLGLHPSSNVLVKHTACTIARLARRGNAIIVGRAGNVVTAKFRNVFHVRLIAPMERRSSRVSQQMSLTAEESRRYIEAVDRRRARYVRQYYAADIKDPLAYHLILNTEKLSHDSAARTIADSVIRFSSRLKTELIAA